MRAMIAGRLAFLTLLTFLCGSLARKRPLEDSSDPMLVSTGEAPLWTHQDGQGLTSADLQAQATGRQLTGSVEIGPGPTLDSMLLTACISHALRTDIAAEVAMDTKSSEDNAAANLATLTADESALKGEATYTLACPEGHGRSFDDSRALASIMPPTGAEEIGSNLSHLTTCPLQVHPSGASAAGVIGVTQSVETAASISKAPIMEVSATTGAVQDTLVSTVLPFSAVVQPPVAWSWEADIMIGQMADRALAAQVARQLTADIAVILREYSSMIYTATGRWLRTDSARLARLFHAHFEEGFRQSSVIFAYEAALQQAGCCFDACARLPHLLLRQGLQRTSVEAVPHIDSAPSTPSSRPLVCSHSGAFHMSYQMTGPQGLSPLALAHRQMQRAQLKLPSRCAALRLKTLSPVGTSLVIPAPGPAVRQATSPPTSSLQPLSSSLAGIGFKNLPGFELPALFARSAPCIALRRLFPQAQPRSAQQAPCLCLFSVIKISRHDCRPPSTNSKRCKLCVLFSVSRPDGLYQLGPLPKQSLSLSLMSCTYRSSSAKSPGLQFFPSAYTQTKNSLNPCISAYQAKPYRQSGFCLHVLFIDIPPLLSLPGPKSGARPRYCKSRTLYSSPPLKVGVDVVWSRGVRVEGSAGQHPSEVHNRSVLFRLRPGTKLIGRIPHLRWFPWRPTSVFGSLFDRLHPLTVHCSTNTVAASFYSWRTIRYSLARRWRFKYPPSRRPSRRLSPRRIKLSMCSQRMIPSFLSIVRSIKLRLPLRRVVLAASSFDWRDFTHSRACPSPRSHPKPAHSRTPSCLTPHRASSLAAPPLTPKPALRLLSLLACFQLCATAPVTFPTLPEPNGAAHVKQSLLRAQKRANRFGRTTYHGRVLTAKQLGSHSPKPAPKSASCTSPPPYPKPHVDVLTWNSSGLSQSKLAELLAWLNAEDSPSRYRIVCITETHWSDTSEFHMQGWNAVHSGFSTKAAGILLLVHEDLCAPHQIRYKEILPGRLVHLRIYQGSAPAIDILGTYQYAWNLARGPGSQPQRRKALLDERLDVWQKIRSWVQSIPARNALLLIGDFNCGLKTHSTHVGRGISIPRSGYPDDQYLFQDILTDYALTALNTWGRHGRKAGTFQHHSGSVTQIDFAIVRARLTTPQALQAKSLQAVPILPKTGMYHCPVHLTFPLPANPTAHQAASQSLTLASVKAQLRASPDTQQSFIANLPTQVQDEEDLIKSMYDSWALACRENPPPATRTKAEQVKEELQRTTLVTVRSLWALRDQVHQNRTQLLSTALLHCVASALTPVQAYLPARVSSWLRTSTSRYLGAILRWWKLSTQHDCQARALRKHCRARKKKHLEALIADAQAGKHCLTALHNILKRFAPKTRPKRIQLRTSSGDIQSPSAELAQILSHFRVVYDSPTTQPSPRAVLSPITFSITEITNAFLHLPRKALPSHYPPAPLWQAAAPLAASVFHECLHQAFKSERLYLPDTWHRIQVALIPKPSKPLNCPGSLRPISLLPPMAKVLAKLLASRIRPFAQEAASKLPQYAYLPQRQTLDALDRAFSHCHSVRLKRQTGYITTRDRYEGKITRQCEGGITFSLDLQRAFDSIPWSSLETSLQDAGVPRSLVHLIMYLHERATYVFRTSHSQGSIFAGQGIRQGCGLAPLVWTIYSLKILKSMASIAPNSQRTLFADDFLFQWSISSPQDFLKIPHQIAGIIQTLNRQGMFLSPGKSVILYSLWGGQVPKLLKPLVRLHPTLGRCFRVPLHDYKQTVSLPVVSTHVYLGMVLSYKNFEMHSLRHRTRQSWIAFNRVKHILCNRTLSLHLRLQLYKALCLSILRYGLPSCGLTALGRDKFTTTVLRQTRMVVRNHSYFTGLSNADFLQRFKLEEPLTSFHGILLNRLRGIEHKPAAQTHPPEVCAWWQHLRSTVEAPSETPVDERQLRHRRDTHQSEPCTVCGAVFVNEAALRFHITKMHVQPDKNTQKALKAALRVRKDEHMLHAHGGLPTCRHCRHKFSSWPQFMSHFNRQCCPVLHLQQASQFPPLPPDPAPLIQQAELLSLAATYTWQELAAEVQKFGRLLHCPLCNLWMAQTGQLVKHMQAQHNDFSTAISLIQQFLLECKGITKPCRFCSTSHHKAAVGCPVLFRVALQHSLQEGRWQVQESCFE